MKRRAAVSSQSARRPKAAKAVGGFSSRWAKSADFDKKVYDFKRTFLLSNSGDDWQYNSSSGANFIPLTVSLAQCPTYTDFTSLFDAYQIVDAEFKFVPHMNVSQVQNPPGTTSDTLPQVARLVTVRDNDDDTSLTLPGAMQYSSFREELLDKQRVRSFKPAVLLQTYRTSTTTGYSASEKPVWVDAAQTDVPHYCGKALILDTTANGSNPRTLSIYCTLTIRCKGAH